MNIHNIFLQAHRGFAYLALLLVVLFVIALIVSLVANGGRRTKLLKISTTITMILFHLQFLVGIIMLVFTSGFTSTISEIGMGGLMKNADLRFTYIEHPFSMLIAAVLMTIVNKKVKTNEKINTGIVIMAVIAVLLFSYAVPFAKLFN